MRRQYVFEVAVFIDAEGKCKVNSFADAKLPLVLDYLQNCPMYEEGAHLGPDHYKKMTLKSVTVRRKNKERT